MTDIVERLRIPPGRPQTITQDYRMMVEERAEAADEIERLRAAVEKLCTGVVSAQAEIERLQSCLYAQESVPALYKEIERLTAERDVWKIACEAQANEVARLRRALEPKP